MAEFVGVADGQRRPGTLSPGTGGRMPRALSIRRTPPGLELPCGRGCEIHTPVPSTLPLGCKSDAPWTSPPCQQPPVTVMGPPVGTEPAPPESKGKPRGEASLADPILATATAPCPVPCVEVNAQPGPQPCQGLSETLLVLPALPYSVAPKEGWGPGVTDLSHKVPTSSPLHGRHLGTQMSAEAQKLQCPAPAGDPAHPAAWRRAH